MRLFFLTIFIAFSFSVQAQQSVTGKISGKGAAVPYATVILSADSTAKTMKAYAISDDEGRFAIAEGAEDGDWLVVRCLGFEELKHQLHADRNLSLQLTEVSETIGEVVVKGKYSGMKFSNDTVLLDTKYYTTGNEQNVGEVLRKIPGMDVSATGKVSFGGRNIDKILVDGKDLLSGSGNVAISTLPPDFMAGAEVLTNYKTNSITDDLKSEETLALNIKSAKKQRINGNIDVAAGYKDKFQAKSSLLYLGEKGSLSSILSGNNTGAPVFSIEDYISSIVGLDNVLGQKSSTMRLTPDESRMLRPITSGKTHRAYSPCRVSTSHPLSFRLAAMRFTTVQPSMPAGTAQTVIIPETSPQRETRRRKTILIISQPACAKQAAYPKIRR